jgi:hypothetical protein
MLINMNFGLIIKMNKDYPAIKELKNFIIF